MPHIPDGFHSATRRMRSRAAEHTPSYVSSEASMQQSHRVKDEGYIQILDWDSHIFGYSVAKILPTRLNTTELGQILQQLKDANVHLVYWASDSRDPSSQTAAETHHGFLADRKTTYLINLPTPIPSGLSNHEVERYTDSSACPALKKLALESGTYSRFQQDPRITPTQFEKIYHQWIDNSVKLEQPIAERVLVIKRNNQVAGFITLGQKEGRGDIGLLAVDEHYRSQQFGSKLVYAALDIFTQQGYQQSQVVTQGNNVPACRLYEHCGYEVEKIENFYHFWL